MAHENAVQHGFYAKEMDLKVWIHAAATSEHAEQENLRALDHALFAQRIALIQSELSEALEADRADRHADLRMFEKKQDEIMETSTFGPEERVAFSSTNFKLNIKDTVEDELADACIRIFDLAGHLGIDLQAHIIHKMQYNLYRPALHGKKY
uniref:hypothetical protein n=1 Tax=Alistipes sp. TaxID=1872444 RepID=UPI004057692D